MLSYSSQECPRRGERWNDIQKLVPGMKQDSQIGHTQDFYQVATSKVSQPAKRNAWIDVNIAGAPFRTICSFARKHQGRISFPTSDHGRKQI